MAIYQRPGDILHAEVVKISDENLVALFNELAGIRRLEKHGMVLHFLQQVFQPFPPYHPQKLKSGELNPGSILRTTVKNVVNTRIYALCYEIGLFCGKGSIENHHRLQLYQIINWLYPQKKKKRTGFAG